MAADPWEFSQVARDPMWPDTVVESAVMSMALAAVNKEGLVTDQDLVVVGRLSAR